MTPDFNTLLHLLGPVLTLTFLTIIGIWGIVRTYLFSSTALNLRFPWEHRLRDRLRDLDERLPLTTDPLIKGLMEQERDRLALQLVLGMDSSQKYGTELFGLYQRNDSRLSWREIRRAGVFLRYRQGQLVKGLDRVEQAFGQFFLWGGAVIMLLGLLFLVVVVGAAVLTKSVLWRTLLSPVLACGSFLLLGFISVNMAIPIQHARRLQRWLPDSVQP